MGRRHSTRSKGRSWLVGRADRGVGAQRTDAGMRLVQPLVIRPDSLMFEDAGHLRLGGRSPNADARHVAAAIFQEVSDESVARRR